MTRTKPSRPRILPAGPDPAVSTARVAGAATLIAVLTILSRVVGFARTFVFNHTVQATDLGDIYLAVNSIPNVVFEIVAGGALAGLVVPLVAGPIAAVDREAVRRIAAALLTWTLTLLVPLALLVALFADPIVGLLKGDSSSLQHDQGVAMLRLFAPQVPLYGIGIVLTGLLQAHRRFAWPVLAPLFSSLTMIVTYLVFASVAGFGPDPSTVDDKELLILAGGTTLGVVVLSLCLLIPARRLGLSWRPSYRMEPDVKRRASRLALAGMATVAVQQLAVLVALRLALEVSQGANTVFNTAQTFYLLPWAVLAVPAATAAYPAIATAHATQDLGALRRTVSRTGRVVILLSCLGAAGLAALAHPVSPLLISDPAQARQLAYAIIAFSPGLVGYGIAALHQRTLYAVGAQRLAALSLGLGWTVVAVSAVALSSALPAQQRPMALALANSIGMTVLAIALALAVRKRCGSQALAGSARAMAAGVVSGLAAGASALWLLSQVSGDTPGVWASIGQGMLSGGVAALVFGAVCAVADRPDLAMVLGKLRRLRRRAGAS